MQTGVHGPIKRSRLSPLGQYETYDWPPQGRAGRDVGGHQRTFVHVFLFCFPFPPPLFHCPNLRKPERASAEREVPADNFDDYWRVASKITPTTLPASSPHAPQSSMHTRPPSADPQGVPDRDGAYNVRSVPIRLYLPEGPVLQDLAPPNLEDGGCLPR
jgi:Autophagy protein Apg5